MTLKQVRNCLNIELRGELMKSSQAEQFEAILKEQQKILERLAIQALITTKVTKIKTLKKQAIFNNKPAFYYVNTSSKTS